MSRTQRRVYWSNKLWPPLLKAPSSLLRQQAPQRLPFPWAGTHAGLLNLWWHVLCQRPGLGNNLEPQSSPCGGESVNPSPVAPHVVLSNKSIKLKAKPQFHFWWGKIQQHNGPLNSGKKQQAMPLGVCSLNGFTPEDVESHIKQRADCCFTHVYKTNNYGIFSIRRPERPSLD